MTYIARNDTSIVGRWWHEVDHGLIWTVLIMIIMGWIIMFTGSAQEALQDGQPLLKFSARKASFAVAGLVLLLGISMLELPQIKLLTLLGFAVSVLLLLSIFVFGVAENGAKRWISVPGVPFYPQPSEFAKPFFVLMVTYCLSHARTWGFAWALLGAAIAFATLMTLLLQQPDVSQAVLLGILFLGLVFLAGIAMQWVLLMVGFGIAALGTAYLNFNHVRYRIDEFLDRIKGIENNRRDQIDMAKDAFRHGGIEGLGLGEGTLKTAIPEAKNDLPLAIIGEEMGLIGTAVVFGLYLMIWNRIQSRLGTLATDFQRLAAAGLAFLLLAQALINIGYTIGYLPTTGLTLPFFSDGGSSLLASTLTVGFLLALTRQRGVGL